ncbi:MAG TPA: family 16 glycoside hydrolase, partial [Isosphaeraceae bacterium]|nr:family 16 glycoside hydrolase [Isosphaeraceae bacterium]
ARPTAKATEDRTRPAGQWNLYRLKSENGTLELSVNGKVVTRASDCTQVKGYLCLESENSEVHFRNIRIQELPSSNPPAEKIAEDLKGFTPLFDGLTFRGWKNAEDFKGRWTAADGVIKLDPSQPLKGNRQQNMPWTETSYENFTLIADWRLTAKPVRKPMNDFTPDGLFRRTPDGKVATHEVLFAGDSGLILRGDHQAQVNIWSQPMGSGDINPYHKNADLSAEIRKACMPSENADNPPGQWNRFLITMKGDRVTVQLNGKTVIDHAELPGVAAQGPIGLQDHGDPIEFRNLYIKPAD